MARAPKRVTFTVEGSGMFPYDMLRYDHAWPLNEPDDSPRLAADWAEGRRRVVLCSDSPQAPTVGRWESFTWRVVGLGELRDPAAYPTPPRR